MFITIMSNNCPKCTLAKKEFADCDPEIISDWADITDPERRRNMISSVAEANEDINNRPLLFSDDKFFKWNPKP